MDEEGGFGGRGGYNSHRTVEVVPMEDGAGRRSKCVGGSGRFWVGYGCIAWADTSICVAHRRRRRGGRKEKGAAGMEEDAPAGEGQEGQPGEQQEQEQQQGEQAPQQEQHYEEPVAAAPAVFENGAGMADAPVGEEGLEGFGDEDFGAAEGGDVDMFL